MAHLTSAAVLGAIAFTGGVVVFGVPGSENPSPPPLERRFIDIRTGEFVSPEEAVRQLPIRPVERRKPAP